MSDFINETDLRRLAERRVDAKAGFWIHAAIYLAVNAGVAANSWAMLATSQWLWWSAGCWGLALAGQGIAVYLPTRDLRRRAVEAELERLRRVR